MTPDEISELAECLADACERSEIPVGSDDGKRRIGESCCPFGALVPGDGWPTPGRVHQLTGIDAEQALAFINGYDGLETDPPPQYLPMFNLGRQFRSQYP